MRVVFSHEDQDDIDMERMVKRYLEDVVQKHVRTILEHQLKNIVEGELARLRLHDPASKPIGDKIEDVLGVHMRKAADDSVPELVKRLMREHFKDITLQLSRT